jgi:hypothetical protein
MNTLKIVRVGDFSIAILWIAASVATMVTRSDGLDSWPLLTIGIVMLLVSIFRYLNNLSLFLGAVVCHSLIICLGAFEIVHTAVDFGFDLYRTLLISAYLILPATLGFLNLKMHSKK